MSPDRSPKLSYNLGKFQMVLLLGYLFSPPLLAQEAKEVAQETEESAVTKPPLSLKLDPFYKKYVDADGIPIVSSEKTADDALYTAQYIVSDMLMKRSDLRNYMIKEQSRVLIMAQSEMETDLPERSDMEKPEKDDLRLTPEERADYDKPGGIGSMTHREYWNERARGMGGIITSCAEENLLGYENDRYSGENILVHEFAHNIMDAIQAVDPKLYAQIIAAYDQALKKGLYKDQYAINTQEEYWAEGTQWWYWSNFEFYDDDTRVQSPGDLKKYDPTLYALLAQVYSGHHIEADVHYQGEVAQD
jgi:hypothetical protein